MAAQELLNGPDKSDALEVYFSDDYAGMKSPRFDFYFGYEATLCSHGADSRDCECEKDYCFTATHKGEEVARYTQAELDEAVTYASPKLDFGEPYGYLLAGIGRYLK